MIFGLENSISIEIVSNPVSNTFLFMYININRPETVGFLLTPRIYHGTISSTHDNEL